MVKNVIIIGAGASGIAAAARLIENGLKPWNITILEARNRIGGRVYTAIDEGHPFELGAQWVHGQEGNVVFDIGNEAHELNTHIKTVESSGLDMNAVFTLKNVKVSHEDIEELWGIVESCKEKSLTELKGWTKSLGDYFDGKFQQLLEDPKYRKIDHTTSLAFLDWFHLLENIINGSDDWKEACGSGYLQYQECPGECPLVTWKRGYSVIFDILLKNAPKNDAGSSLPLSDRIRLNKEVVKIEWDRMNEFKAEQDRNVKITCRDGTIFEASLVLITASLGVLKKNINSWFQPELPPFKRKVIEGLGYGTVNKIFLKFEKPWWTPEWVGISFLHRRPDDENQNQPFIWSNHILGFYTLASHPKLLIGWVSGKAARECESLSDSEVIQICSNLLESALGTDFAYIKPSEVIRSFWHSDPFSLGSYSYRSVKSKQMNVWASDLAQPIYDSFGCPRLFFAGEATHDRFYSTVHGAIETGWREGDRIAQYFHGSPTAKL